MRDFRLRLRFYLSLFLFGVLIFSCSLFPDDSSKKFRLDRQIEYDGDGNVTNIFEYIYSDDLMINRINTIKDGSLTQYTRYELNDDGTIIKSDTYNASDDLVVSFSYEYDSSGSRITKVDLYTASTDTHQTYAYTYDSKKRRTRIDTITAAGTITNYQVFDYKDNKILSSARYDADGNLQSRASYEYSSEGISKITFCDKDGKVTSYRVFEITKADTLYNFMLYGRW